MSTGRTPSEAISRQPSRSLASSLRGALQMAHRAAPRATWAALASQVVAGIGATLQLLLGRTLLAEILGTGETAFQSTSVIAPIAMLVAVSAVVACCSVVQTSTSMVLSEAIGRDATGRVLEVTTAVEPATYEDPEFQDLIHRVRSNAASRSVMAVNGLLGVLGAITMALGVALALAIIAPLLLPLAILGVVPAWLAGTVGARRFHELSRLRSGDDQVRSYLLHVLSNRDLAKELRIFGAEEGLRRRHDRLYDERVDAVSRLARSRRHLAFLAVAAGSLVLLLSLLGLFWAVEHGHIGLAGASTALFALLVLVQRLRALVSSAGVLYEATLFIDDAEELQAYRPAAEGSTTAAVPLAPFGELRAEGLEFSYPGAETAALRGVDLVIHRGETVALVGENGSGKTTLAKLLTGLHRPTGGQLHWDDLDTATVEPARLRRSTAVVFQDFGRFQLSAADNVALGAGGAVDEAALTRAAEAAGARAVVAALPQGWEQRLGRMYPDGVDLSGGQWQRLALARALLREAPFLVMDEPSAALDARGEKELFTRLSEIAAGRSVLFISHRFSTVRLADRIYVMDAGRVVEQGSHDDLMALDGHYAEMYRLQASMYG